MTFRSFFAVSALAVAALGMAQFSGTAPVVTKKPAFKRVIGPKSKPIDTRSFSPQIKEISGQIAPREVENKFNHVIYNITEANTIQLGGVMPTQAPISTTKQFPAIGATGWVPPDPDVAVGQNHIVAVVNVAIAFYTKTGTRLFQQTLDGAGFFSGMEVTSFCFDPKVFYDSSSNRFFVIILEKQDSPSTISKCLVAVSDDGDPNGIWHRYRIEAKQTVNNAEYWLDYPGWGANKDSVLITGNMFGFTSGYNGIQYILINKAEMLTGAEPVINYFGMPGDSVQVMRTPDNTLDTLYAVSHTGPNTAMLHAFTDLLGTPVLTTVPVAIPTFTRPTSPVTSTGGRLLDSLDGRFLNCQVRNGRLYTAHTVRASTDGTNGSRWYEFNINGWPSSGSNPTLRQAGTVALGSGIHYWMPAIAVNAGGDIAMVFSRASSSITADFMATSRRSTDPLGFMGTPVRLVQSIGSTYGSPRDVNRWGDYFGCQVDPVDNQTFWGIGMIANAGGSWQTVVNSFKVSTPFSGNATSIAKFEGGTATGSLSNVLASDNLYFTVNSAPVDRTGQVASATATFTVSQSNIATLNFNMETAAATNVTGSLFIWDWTTSKWVYVGATPQTSADKTWTLGVSAPFSRYINSSTKQVKILVRAIMPFSTIRPAVPFQFKIDRLSYSGSN